jgi:hypothetical protein
MPVFGSPGGWADTLNRSSLPHGLTTLTTGCAP